MANECGVCTPSCNDNYAISCSKWYHIQCVAITTPKLDYYADELKKKKGEHWFCNKCKFKVRVDIRRRFEVRETT